LTSKPVQLARIAGLALLALTLWAAALAVIVAMRDDEIQISANDAEALIDAAKRQDAKHRGNLALVVIDDGRISGSHFHSIGRPVDADTLFQMASVSKWITAWGVMTLVESGKIDLDAPVSRYLKRWRLPPSDYDNDLVTVRRLLSHTAGLTDGLGYCGFAPGQPLQPLPASLTAAADACPFTNGKVAVGARPGGWQYSGGGYALLQLMIEDVSGRPFADYMDAAVLKPLGMQRSTFCPRACGATNVAAFFDVDGSPAPHFAYTAASAASLYSSASDLARFVNAQRDGPDGAIAGRSVLSRKSLAMMLQPQVSIAGRPHWGLGVRLYAPARSGGDIVGHDGGNVPAVNTAIRLDPKSGDAVVALSTGGNVIATRLASAWLRQRVDEADLPDSGLSPFAVLARLYSVRFWLAGGAVIICIIGLVAGFRVIRRGTPGRTEEP
jgi:CubicO group peptidase (beta-lactamase class C family)